MQPNPFDILLDQVRQVVREEVERGVKQALNQAPADRSAGKTPETAWLRAEELAKMYNLPRTFFEEKGREGKITRTKPGRYVLFKLTDVERYLQSIQTGGASNEH